MQKYLTCERGGACSQVSTEDLYVWTLPRSLGDKMAETRMKLEEKSLQIHTPMTTNVQLEQVSSTIRMGCTVVKSSRT